MVSLKPKPVVYRRKREHRTSYTRRLSLLLSGKPRLVVRLTNQRFIAQLIKFTPQGDQVLIAMDSFALKKIGWTYSCKNTRAAYLTGLWFGKKAVEQKIKEAVLDTGFKSPLKKGKIYAFLQGVVDSKLKVAHGEGIFPSEDRIMGKHINESMVTAFNQVKVKIS